MFVLDHLEPVEAAQEEGEQGERHPLDHPDSGGDERVLLPFPEPLGHSRTRRHRPESSM